MTLLALLPFVLAAWVAAVFIAWPLWRRRRLAGPDAAAVDLRARRARLRELESERRAGLIDEGSYLEARTELERDLLAQDEESGTGREIRLPGASDGRTIYITAVLVPVLAAGVYGLNGRPDLILGGPERDGVADRGQQIALIEERLPAVERRVAERPADVEAWAMLVRGYLALNRPKAAADAAARGIEVNGDIPALLVLRARALAFSAEGRFPEEAAALLERALRRAPAYPDALWFRGLAAAQNGNWDTARQHWSALRQTLPDDAQSAARLDEAIARLPGGEGMPASALELSVKVRVAEGLDVELPPETPVFVFARSPGAEGMPLAAARTTLGALPGTVVLDDMMAQASGREIEAGARLEIVARVSASGRPAAGPGDLEGRRVVTADDDGGAFSVVVDSRQ